MKRCIVGSVGLSTWGTNISASAELILTMFSLDAVEASLFKLGSILIVNQPKHAHDLILKLHDYT